MKMTIIVQTKHMCYMKHKVIELGDKANLYCCDDKAKVLDKTT